MHLMEIHKQALRAFKDIDIVQEYQYFMGLLKADDLLYNLSDMYVVCIVCTANDYRQTQTNV